MIKCTNCKHVKLDESLCSRNLFQDYFARSTTRKEYENNGMIVKELSMYSWASTCASFGNLEINLSSLFGPTGLVTWYPLED